MGLFSLRLRRVRFIKTNYKSILDLKDEIFRETGETESQLCQHVIVNFIKNLHIYGISRRGDFLFIILHFITKIEIEAKFCVLLKILKTVLFYKIVLLFYHVLFKRKILHVGSYF